MPLEVLKQRAATMFSGTSGAVVPSGEAGMTLAHGRWRRALRLAQLRGDGS